MFAILIEGGSANHVQFATGEHRLEHVSGIHGPFGSTGANHGVEFVDEEDDILTILNLFQYRLEALLKLTTILCTGDQCAEVEGNDLAILERFGDITPHDALGQPLDDSGLADTRFTDQDGIVFGAAAQDLDDPADLLIATNDRVELIAQSLGGQVAPILFEGGVGTLGVGAGYPLRAPHFAQGGEEALAAEASLFEQTIHGATGMVEEGQEQMFGRDILITKASKLIVGAHDDGAEA